jgi:DNA-binding GntR family transcriptional regulator
MVGVDQYDATTANGRKVYDELHRRIIDGEMGPGTRLVEADLAKFFGVSRTPVREALNRLAHEGLLERHDRAMRVRILGAEDVMQLFEVRIALERAAGRGAAERRTDLDLRALHQATEAMLQLPDEQIAARSKLAHGFHFALWAATHNPVLIETLRTVHLRVIGLARTTLYDPTRWEALRGECVNLVDAVEDRDVEAAGRISELQMINSRDFRLDLYTENGGRAPEATVHVPAPTTL